MDRAHSVFTQHKAISLATEIGGFKKSLSKAKYTHIDMASAVNSFI